MLTFDRRFKVWQDCLISFLAIGRNYSKENTTFDTKEPPVEDLKFNKIPRHSL